jgi:hypothetical protein
MITLRLALATTLAVQTWKPSAAEGNNAPTVVVPSNFVADLATS